MQLTTNHAYWLHQNGIIRTYPRLRNDAEADVVVLGAGITGAMVAQRLAKEGHRVLVIDKRDVACGSTSASTALLQYEIDVSLVDLSKKIGPDRASEAYRISHASIDRLETLANSLGNPCDFRRATSLYFADSRSAALSLAKEYRARSELGLDVTYHDQLSTRQHFLLEGCACLSSQQAASCDPYRLTHALLWDAQGRGAQIYDRTEIVDARPDGSELVLVSKDNVSIRCRWMVVATGYESVKWLPEKILNLDNTYAIITEPLEDGELGGWNPNWMLWEAKDPYLYLRMTSDRRLLIGGEDERFHSATRRQSQLAQKSQALEKKGRKLLPFVSFCTDYCWAGTFGKTRDGLAYIDRHPQHPQILFALGFGGNGITFSQIATDILAAELASAPLPYQSLFAFHR